MTPSILVPFPDGVQVEFVYTWGTFLFSNRLWLLNRQPPNTQAQLDALASAAATYWAVNMLPLQSHDVTLSRVSATSWDDPLSPLVGFTVPNLNGGVVEKSYSANVAIWVRFNWPINAVHARNGNFFGGVPDSAVSGNVIDQTYARSLFEAYGGIIDAAPVWGSFPAYWWVVVSLEENKSLRSEMFIRLAIGPTVKMPFVTQRRSRLKN